MATRVLGAAPARAERIVVNGLVGVPSLSVPLYAASTNRVSDSTGMSPQGASPQGPTGRQADSPGIAIWPLAHVSAGSTARHARASSGSKPAAQELAGMPAGSQPPPSRRTS